MTTQGQSGIARCNALPVTHVDLATLTALEAYLYGGISCSSWLMREVNKVNWAAVGLTTLRNAGGKANYGSEVSWIVSRGGDYLLTAWFRGRFPLVKLRNDACFSENASIRYTKNFMHNLVRSGSLTVNELCVSVFDTFILDIRQAFWLPANKQLGYKNLIGDIPTMTSPAGYDPSLEDFEALGTGGFFTLVLPFFFNDDYGVSLPTASLVYVDLYINLEFANWEDLIIVHPGSAEDAAVRPDECDGRTVCPTISDVVRCSGSGAPSIEEGEVYAEYAIVNNDERKAMAKMKRTMVTHNWQRLNEQTYKTAETNYYNLRFSYNVKAIFTAARNDSTAADGSNYTTLPFNQGVDPIAFENLQYENSSRTGDLASDVTSLIYPFIRPGLAVPEVTGLHLFPYSLDIIGQDPSYGPNLGKINQVILNSFPSEAARLAGMGMTHFGSELDTAKGAVHNQTFTMMVAAYAHSLINIGSGTITIPVV